MQIDLRKYIPFLKQTILVGLLVSFGAALITIFIPNSYQSVARILPADARGGGAGMGSLSAAAAAVGVTIPGQDSPDIAYIDILNSRWLRERLLKRTYRFMVKSWYFGAQELHEESLAKFLRAKNEDQGVARVRHLLKVTRDLKTKLLTLTVETVSPELSHQVAQEAVRLLEEFVMQRTRTRGGIKAAFSQERLKEANDSLVHAEDAFRRFMDSNRNFQMSPDPSVRLRGVRLESDLKLRQQLLATLTLSREQALLEEKNDMPILNVMDAGNLPIEKSAPIRSLIVLLAGVAGSMVSLLIQTGKLSQILGKMT